MLGNLSYINHKIIKNEECPIKELKTIELINELYWREFKRLIHHSEFPVLELKHIGLVYANNGALRRYIRQMIEIVRKLRKSEGFRKGWQYQVDMEKDALSKLSSACKQMNNLRHVYIARKEKYNKKKILSEADKITG